MLPSLPALLSVQVIMDVLPSAPAGWQRPSSQDSRAPLSSAAAANGKVVDVEIASTTSQLVNAQTESSRDGSSASYQVVDEASSALASSAGPGAKTELERPKAVRHTAPNGLDGGLLRENGASTSGYASKLPSEKSLLKQPEFRVEGNDLLVLLPELGTAPVTIDEDSLPHVIGTCHLHPEYFRNLFQSQPSLLASAPWPLQHEPCVCFKQVSVIKREKSDPLLTCAYTRACGV